MNGDLPEDRLTRLTHWEADWQGLPVVVIGMGSTGFSSADTLIELGARVTVIADSDTEEARKIADTLSIIGAEAVLFGERAPERLPDFSANQKYPTEAPQLVVTSPGIPPHHPWLAEAQQRKIAIWSDVELAWRVQQRAGKKTPQWLTITGTNGKTTTTTMTAQILQAAGLRAAAVGNIGIPVLDAVREPEAYDALVVELSSFQLHWSESLSPAASVCLNLAEDHVDWHGSFEAYAADKAKIYQNTQIACIYNVEQPATETMVEEADVVEGCRAIGFTTGIPAISMVGVVENLLVDRAFISERKKAAVELVSLEQLVPHASNAPLAVPQHLVANAAAAAALTRAIDIPPEAIRAALSGFDQGQHRMEVVENQHQIQWINDSKATNPHAAAASLAAYSGVIWLAGGDAKGVGYDSLVEKYASHLKAVILLGVDSSSLFDALSRHAPDIPVFRYPNSETGITSLVHDGNAVMNWAVQQAAQQAAPGDTVLLAPAAASIDQFRSYAQRGEAFKAAVQNLEAGEG